MRRENSVGRKKVCKHSLNECLVTYHYNSIISKEPFEITRHELYCTKCGLIVHKRFEDDFEKKRFFGTDRMGFFPISSEMLYNKYPKLIRFDIFEDSTEFKDGKINI